MLVAFSNTRRSLHPGCSGCAAANHAPFAESLSGCAAPCQWFARSAACRLVAANARRRCVLHQTRTTVPANAIALVVLCSLSRKSVRRSFALFQFESLSGLGCCHRVSNPFARCCCPCRSGPSWCRVAVLASSRPRWQAVSPFGRPRASSCHVSHLPSDIPDRLALAGAPVVAYAPANPHTAAIAVAGARPALASGRPWFGGFARRSSPGAGQSK